MQVRSPEPVGLRLPILPQDSSGSTRAGCATSSAGSDLRVECARQLVRMGFPGYAVGGLSVGEPPADMYRMLDVTCPELPEDRPRYLMGVGTPVDLLEAIRRGVDMFDCVIPTRNGRNALALTADGPLKMRNLKHQSDCRPIDQDCPCPACRHHSRGYLRHLFMADEMLGPSCCPCTT
jgi:queuine tRNA-ribosyltransferase